MLLLALKILIILDNQSLSLCSTYEEPGQFRAKVCLATHLVSSMKQQHAPRKEINLEMVVHPHYPPCLQKFMAQRLPQPEVVDPYLVILHRFFFSGSLGGLLNTLCILRIHKTSYIRMCCVEKTLGIRRHKLCSRG